MFHHVVPHAGEPQVTPKHPEPTTPRHDTFPIRFGGPISRIVFAVLVLLIAVAIVALVFHGVLTFWNHYLTEVKENAGALFLPRFSCGALVSVMPPFFWRTR